MELSLHIPDLGELCFRQQMLADPETMAYNHAWGGTIAWPLEKWKAWYEWWIIRPEGKRFYRYLVDDKTGLYVGEIAYHVADDTDCMCMANVIIHAAYRGKGCGREGLRLLCKAAKENGFAAIYDNIAADNPAIKLFIDEGFEIVSENSMTRLLKKDLLVNA